MKTKLFLLLTAAMLLLSVNVSAQTKKAAEKKAVKTEKRATAKKAPAGTPLKGDVNEDGVVDVADIAAVIAIMKNGGGTGEETKYYWYVGTTKPTSLEYQGVTTVNEYPAEQLYTNETGSKAYIYVLTNSDKTVNFYDPSDITSPATTDIDTTTIPGYKITSMNFRVSIGGTILIKISDTYYWYVGTTIPTDPSDVSQNTGLNQWTNLGTRLPDSSIKVAKSDTNYKLHTWYIAAPSDANFILYNATNVASNEAAWNKTSFNVGTVQYTLWTSKEPGWQAVGYLHK